LLGAVAALHLLFARAFMWAPIRWDEQYFLFEGFSLGRGMVPYRDFEELKPPLVFVVNMLALKVFGLEGMRFRYFFELLSLSGFLAIAIALLSRKVPRLIVFGLEALMINLFFDGAFLDLGVNNTSETAGLAFFMLAVGVLLMKTRRTALQQYAGGALLILSPLGKEPFVIPTFAAWLALLWLHQIESDDAGAWRRFVKRTCTGAASVIAVWFAYMLITRSFGWYLVQLRQTLVYSAEHNVMYGVFPKLDFWDTWAENRKRLSDKFVNPARMTVFLPYFLAALLLWRRRSLSMAAASLATFAAALYAVTIGRGFFGHYFIMAMSGTFLFAVLGAVAMNDQLHDVAAPWRRWVCIVLGATAVSSLWPRVLREREQWAAHKPPASPVSEELVRIIKARTTRDDMIWNIGTPAVNVFSDRVSASRILLVHDSLLHLYPGRTDEEKLATYRRELDAHMPKLVILSVGRAGREREMDTLVTPFLRAHGYKQLPERSPVPIYQRPY
jgi:hypothetical protein